MWTSVCKDKQIWGDLWRHLTATHSHCVYSLFRIIGRERVRRERAALAYICLP